jgi:hypothetical protein
LAVRAREILATAGRFEVVPTGIQTTSAVAPRVSLLRKARNALVDRFRPWPPIVYPALGEYGRLGNQLWQIAGTLGIAAQRRTNAWFNPWPYMSLFSVPGHHFVDGPLEGDIAWTITGHIAEPFRFYLQDVSLWRDIEPRIHEYFTPSDHSLARMTERFSDLLAIPNKTALHIRRGDFLEHPTAFPVQTESYCRQGLEAIGDSNVLVFSDDIAWCREHLAWVHGALFVEGNADHEDLFLMTRCEHHVIANSSFSWWGAFLSGDPHPIYPVNWYGDGFLGLGINPRLLFVDEWIGIDA